MKFIRPVAITDERLVDSSVPETLPEYAAGASYGEGAQVRWGHRVYESAAADNSGHALTDPAWWIDLGPTNRWAMFDDVNSTATAADDIAFTVRPGVLIDSIALMDVAAAAVTVTATSDIEGEVYRKTFGMTSGAGVNDFYSWFFEPIERLTTLVVDDIPPLFDIAVTVELDGEELSLATFVMGLMKQIGGTQYGASIGIRDYSRKDTDETFGTITLIKRAYSKRGNFSVFVDAGMVDPVAQMLARYRATPLVWIGSDTYGATVIFGFYKDWSLEIAYPTASLCTLEIEGLT